MSQFGGGVFKPVWIARQQGYVTAVPRNSVATARPTPAPAPLITAIFRIFVPVFADPNRTDGIARELQRSLKKDF
jgi:hypothetical protein